MQFHTGFVLFDARTVSSWPPHRSLSNSLRAVWIEGLITHPRVLQQEGDIVDTEAPDPYI